MAEQKVLADEEFSRRARDLEWLLFDVDGVLSPPQLLYTAEGETTKHFHVRDGLGIRLAQAAGLRLGILSGRESLPLATRASQLDFDDVILGSGDKGRDFEDFADRYEVSPARVAYVGDDLQDLPALRRCGLSFAPADAEEAVCRRVDRVLARRGGDGAAREMIETILRARGDWDDVTRRFFEG